MKKIIVTLSLIFPLFVQAAVIEFSNDELATETVLPIFDRNLSVMNRNVITGGRGEVGLFGGMSLYEPFFSQTTAGVYGTYFFNEFHAAHFSYLKWLSGYTSTAENLRSKSDIHLYFENAPAPESLFTGDYQYTAWYGKLSVTKQAVINMTMYGFVGGAGVTVGGKMEPGITFGLGQNFYITKSDGIRFDLRFVTYQGPNPLAKGLDQNPGPSADQFSRHTIFSSLLTIGYVRLL